VSDDEELPTQLGRYRIVRRLGTGGMAEVFLAKSTGAEGIEKVLVVKRVLPTFARSAKFISMFIDEAKVAMRLNHPNIVQVYAFEQVQREFLLAMEFVDGLDLGRLVAAARRQGKRVPYGLAAFLVMEMAKGLDYAHKRRDASGEAMEIVHRDVSPQNVLLTYDGVVKVADFGIAKAKLVSEETGVIKGKFAYMSPEQARGQHVDHRSDVYSLGVLLAEVLMNRAMYPGEHGLDVLEKVRDAKLTLPRAVDPEVPRELERIVKRATAPDPEERYQTARALAGALTRYLHNLDEVWDGEALEHFIAEIAPRVQTSPDGQARDIQTFAGGATVFSGVGAKESRERRRVVVVAGRFRGDTTSAGTDPGASVGDEVAKVLADIAYKADAVLSWPDGLGKQRFRFIVGLGKASVTDPLKATRLALDTLEALDGLSADLLSPVSASMGMSRGMVSTARDQAGRLLRYAPVGAVLEVAEGLADAGRPGNVVAAGEVYRLVRRDFAFEADPVEVDLRTGAGSERRPVSGWQLRGALSSKERQAEAEVGHTGLYGRNDELRTVAELYEEVRESGKTSFVVLVGDLGVGKTVLLSTALREWDPTPRVLRAECAYGTADVPYATISEMLATEFDLGEELGAHERREKLEAVVADLVAPEAFDETVDAIGPLLGAGEEGPRDQGDRSRMVRRGVENIVASMAARGPLVIWVDALQWADTPSLELLAAMHQRSYPVPVLVLLSSRPDERVEPLLSRIARIDLEALPTEARRQMVRARFDARVPDDIFQAIDNRAGGNPFFIAELVDALLDRKVVRVDGEGGARRVIRNPGSSIQLPTTLEGVIASRLDELSETERHALRWLSVAGAGLRTEDLSSLTGTDLGATLEELEDRGLIEARPGGSFSFPSAVVRQVAYEATDMEDRVRMHRRVAQLLKGTDRAVAPGRIARHLEQAGERAAAARAYLDAATAAREVFSNREALRFFGRALQLLAPDDVEGRFTAHRGREEILHFLGQTHDQLREIEAMRSLSARGGGPKRRALSLLARARFDLEGGRHAAVQEQLPDALDAAHAAGDDALVIEALRLEAELARYRGEPQRALKACDEALERAGLSRELLPGRGQVLVQRGIILRRLGRGDEALEAYAEAIVIFRRLGLRSSEATALNSLGVALASSGAYEDAITAIRASLLLDRQTGDRLRLGRKLSNVGQLYDALGDADRGLGFVRRSLDVFEVIDDRTGRCDALSSLADMLLDAGSDEAAVQVPLDQSRRIAERLRSSYDLARERIARARLERRVGNLDAARVAAEEGVDTARNAGLVSYEIHARAQLAAALGALGRVEEARSVARETWEKMGDGREVEQAERVFQLLATVFDELEELELAEQSQSAAEAVIQRKAKAIRNPELRRRYLAARHGGLRA